MENNDDQAQIEQSYIKMYDGMISKNNKTLDEVLDDSFILIHMTGMRQSKNEFIKAIQNGTLNYYSCNDTKLSISVIDNKAFITGKSYVNAAVFGGGRHTWSLQLDIDLIKKNGNWFMTEARASTF